MYNTKPTKQEFNEDSEIVYRLSVEVNGEDVITMLTGYEMDDLYRQSEMIETTVREALSDQYEDIYGLPEPEEEEIR